MRPRYEFGRVRRGLRDFQRQTVDYAFQRLYLDNDPVKRFLVADEVGLGKTLVARGLIARAIEHLQDTVERIDIVYVCSNADIARQNIARLNVTGRDDFKFPPRITLLPTRLRELNSPDPDGRAKVNFVSFTPGTSFDLGHRGGQSAERVLLHELLRRAWGSEAVKGAGAINVLRAGSEFDNFKAELRYFDPGTVDEALAAAFVRQLKENDRTARRERAPTIATRFVDLRQRMARSRHRRRDEDRRDQLRLLGDLRQTLARSCVDALEPDLVILDEFQRFKYLLDRESEAGELAHDLFNHPDARVLLLSATPYKMYTVADDVTDDHYADFVETLRFLYHDDEDQLTRFRRDLRSYREALLGGVDTPMAVVRRRRRRLEKQLRRVMVRTERLASTPDRNGMLKERLPPTSLIADDVKAYVAVDKLARLLDAGDVLEYWKSTPYLINFMEDYKLGRTIEDAVSSRRGRRRLELADAARDAARIDWAEYERYGPVAPGNPRVRALFDEVIETGAWRLLWLPPSLPYHELGGPFADPRCAALTKRLVFSAWAAVPRAIATLTSYEAERQIMSRRRGRALENSAAAREKLRPLLRFARSQGRLTGMPVFTLMLPSPTLARLADPLRLASGAEHCSLLNTRELARTEAEKILAPLLADREGPPDPRWYWASPLLLDDRADRKLTAWLERWNSTQAWTGQIGAAESSALAAHVSSALELVYAERTAERSNLGAAPTDLADVVGLLSLAGPANCALRALTRTTRRRAIEADEYRDAAARVAWGVRSLFNSPEATYLVRHGKTPYWQRVLEYSHDGCFQAVLDEYAHVLPEWLGLADRKPEEVATRTAETMFEVLSMRRVSYGVRDLDLADSAEPLKRRTMGGRFALRFGDERSDDGGESRRSHVRTAFNSPFWPFVLASTSVGQEGLDFHLYCHAVVHWNLPANPVDLEQREGRIHRYKGHAVRRNLAQELGDEVLQAAPPDPWRRLFEEGTKRRLKSDSDIVPLWVYKGSARIERIVPALPLSRDRSRLEALKRSLVAYRLAFGQPRQEELVAYLRTRFSDEDIDRLKGELHIDLSPSRRRSRRPRSS